MFNKVDSTDKCNTIPAVIVGMDCATGLQTARILNRRGIPVVGVVESARHFACRTRHCQRVVAIGNAPLVDELEKLATQLPGRPVLIPCSDTTVLEISRARERLRAGYRMALPDHNTLELLLDKGRFYQFAEQQGWPVPKTYFLHNRSDVAHAAQDIRYPCVLKPAIKTPAWEINVKSKAFKITDADELLRVYDRCAQWSSLLTVQEWIGGDETNLHTCNCVFDESAEPLATFVSRKLRQWPPETGIGSLAEECRNDIVRDTTIRLFQSVNYHGLAYLELKYDQPTGRYVIIEANVGRPTGRSATAEACGVEFLYSMYCNLTGMPLPEAREQRYAGVKWIYWRKDLCAAFYHWRRRQLTLWQWWRSVRGPKVCAVFSWSDLAPFLADLWQTLTKRRQRERTARDQPATSVARHGIGVS